MSILLYWNVFIQYQSGPELLTLFEMSSRFMARLCSLTVHKGELVQSADVNQFNYVSHSKLM